MSGRSSGSYGMVDSSPALRVLWTLGFPAGRRLTAARAVVTPLPAVAGTAYGRTSTKPAATKSPSNASASLMRRRRINAKLVASTKE